MPAVPERRGDVELVREQLDDLAERERDLRMLRLELRGEFLGPLLQTFAEALLVEGLVDVVRHQAHELAIVIGDGSTGFQLLVEVVHEVEGQAEPGQQPDRLAGETPRPAVRAHAPWHAE